MPKNYHILSLALALVSCGSNPTDEPTSVVPDTPDPVEEQLCAMAFTPQSIAESRDVASDEVAAALGNRFAVVAWKNQKEYVMAKDAAGSSPYIVDYNSSKGWNYADASDQYLKYWDFSARKYTFYAIANYSDFDVSFSDGICQIAKIDTDNPNSAKLLESYYKRDGVSMADYDLLVSSTEPYYVPLIDGDTFYFADIVPLPFHYMLSQVQFKIYNKSPQNGLSIPITHATIKIYDSDGFYTTCSYSNLNFNFSDSDSKNNVFVDDELSDAFIKSSKKNAATLCSCIVLPQPLALKADVAITTNIGTLTGTVDLVPGWERGKIYTYYLFTEYTEDYILVDTVEIDDWIPEKSIENTQTNW